MTLALGSEMLLLAGIARDGTAARRQLETALRSGAAADKARALIEAQGGNPAVVDDPALLPRAPRTEPWHAPREGFVQRVEPRAIGQAIVAMGGGRATPDGAIDPTVGFVITAKPGDRCERGQPVATIHARDDAGLASGREALLTAIAIGEEPPMDVLPLVSHRVTGERVEELD